MKESRVKRDKQVDGNWDLDRPARKAGENGSGRRRL
jgi:hypothetical protein